jgi:HAMP domain-containing protein
MGMESFGGSAPRNRQELRDQYGKYIETTSMTEVSEKLSALESGINEVDQYQNIDEADAHLAELDELETAFKRIASSESREKDFSNETPEMSDKISAMRASIRSRLPRRGSA